MKFSVYQASHIGGRARNEDRVGYTYTRQAVLLVLADGMGGHPDGDQAADIAVRTFVQAFVGQAVPKLADPRAFLEATVMQASQAIVDFAHAHHRTEHPRTTVVAAVVQDGELTALHSGDSRLYWARDGRLVARTRDHSYHNSTRSPCRNATGPSTSYSGGVSDAVAQLSELAVRRGGRHGDNVSLIGLEWQADDGFPSTQVLEPAWLAHAAAAPAPLPAEGLPAAELDDAEIERTIAEINDAIRRTRRQTPPAQVPTRPERKRPS